MIQLKNILSGFKICDWMSWNIYFVFDLLDIYGSCIIGIVSYLALHYNPISVITSLMCVVVMEIEIDTTWYSIKSIL